MGLGGRHILTIYSYTLYWIGPNFNNYKLRLKTNLISTYFLTY